MASVLRALAILGSGLQRLRQLGRGGPVADDPATAELLRRAHEARRAGQTADATTLFHRVLDVHRSHPGALRALRELAVEAGRWEEALDLQQRLAAAVGPAERAEEAEWLAAIHYRLGGRDLERGAAAGAAAHFKNALRADRDFLPAAIALGDAWEAAGDAREALRAWERAAETQPAPPLLARLERRYREEGRPSRMIGLYRQALERAPDDPALALALGRVLYELEMLDEAADHLEKLEVRAPGRAPIHAFLGAVFERRGQSREAFEEYRRALRLAHAFDWPYTCRACGASAPVWQDRCSACGRWNALWPSRA